MKRYIVVASILAFFFPPYLPCQEQPDLRQLASDAGIIFQGAVEGVERVPHVPGDLGIVRVTFRVTEALRGAVSGQALTIREWDGLWHAGDRYRVGERVLLFLYPPSGDLGLTTTVGGEQGRIRVADSQLSIPALARQIGEPAPVAVRRKRWKRPPKLQSHDRMWIQEW